jgi:hypothetical protein
MAPGLLYPLGQSGVDAPNDSAGHPHHQGTRRYRHPFGDHSTRRDDTAASDAHPVEQHASHSDETIVSHGAAVKDDAMTYGDALADGA